jgi:RNA polymerase sigma-70 factor, ECF subfamily
MRSDPSTQSSLLVRLRDRRDRDAWGQFDEIYRPLVVGFARAKGLQAADAEDVWQDVLVVLDDTIDRFSYDPSKSFAGWLCRIALNKIRDRRRRGAREIPGTGRTSIQEILEAQPAPEDAERFERECDRRRLEWAVGKVLGEIAEARQAYQQAKELTYARCWDPGLEMFWAPAKKAEDDLANLDESIGK